MASRFAFLHEINSLYHDKGFAGHGRQPGLLLNQPPKSIRVNINPLIKSCGTRTDPSTWTESVGLPADAAFSEGRRSVVMVFAHHLDNFIMTPSSRSLIVTLQKPRHRDADANSLNHRAVRFQVPGRLTFKRR